MFKTHVGKQQGRDEIRPTRDRLSAHASVKEIKALKPIFSYLIGSSIALFTQLLAFIYSTFDFTLKSSLACSVTRCAVCYYRATD